MIGGLILIATVLLLGTLLVRNTGRESIQSIEEATIGLEGLTPGCLEFTQAGPNASVCVNRSEDALALEISGFQPGSELTATGSTGESVAMLVDVDGTLQSELGGVVRAAPVLILGALADGRPSAVTVELLN